MGSVKAHVLYRHYGHDDTLLYVGITMNPVQRWQSHQHGKEWWLDVARTTMEHYDSRPAVLAAEAEAIRAERPLYNVVHNRPRPKRAERTHPRVTAEDMPDGCHDYCERERGDDEPVTFADSVNYPYQWVNGVGYYLCKNGHGWNCWWGHDETGWAPDAESRTRPVRMIDGVCPACAKRFKHRAIGRKCPNCSVQLVAIGEIFFPEDGDGKPLQTYVFGPYGWESVPPRRTTDVRERRRQRELFEAMH